MTMQIIKVLVIMSGCSESGKLGGWMTVQIIKVLVIMRGCSVSKKERLDGNANK